MTKQLYAYHTIVNELIETTKTRALGPSVKIDKNDESEKTSFSQGLDELLKKRQSTRFFNQDQAIAYEDLVTMLKNNIQFHKKNWNRDFEEGINLEQYVLIRRVANNPNIKSDYIYKFTEEEELELLNDIKLTNIIEELFLQKEFAQAPAIIIFAGRLEKTISLYGPRGYNLLLRKSGAVAEYAWLQALDLGYVGTVFAGILPRGLGKITDLDGYRKCQMFAFAFGQPY